MWLMSCKLSTFHCMFFCRELPKRSRPAYSPLRSFIPGENVFFMWGLWNRIRFLHGHNKPSFPSPIIVFSSFLPALASRSLFFPLSPWLCYVNFMSWSVSPPFCDLLTDLLFSVYFFSLVDRYAWNAQTHELDHGRGSRIRRRLSHGRTIQRRVSLKFLMSPLFFRCFVSFPPLRCLSDFISFYSTYYQTSLSPLLFSWTSRLKWHLALPWNDWRSHNQHFIYLFDSAP